MTEIPTSAWTLALDNRPLAVAAAHRYLRRFRPRGLDADDLVQAALLGLARACATWDAAQGTLSTWAREPMRYAMQQATADAAAAVAQPIYRVQRGEVLLDAASLDGFDQSDRHDLLAVTDADPADADERQTQRARLEQALARLPAAEADLVRGRLTGETLEQAAARTGLTRERVRQKLDVALRRVQAWVRK